MQKMLNLFLASSLSFALSAQVAETVEFLGTYRGLGGQFASTLGPGPTAGSERLYATYLYLNDTFELVAIDPDSSKVQVFENPVMGEYAARCITAGPDGRIYVGTAPTAHLLQLDPSTNRFTDLGRPSTTESFIWDITFGADGKLYGGTSPTARLIRFDPATRSVEDLGRMDPKEEYAHYLAASEDGFVYVGIGVVKMNIVAYRVKDGTHRKILPAEFQVGGQARVYKGTDGRTYGIAGTHHFLLQGWEALPIAPRTAAQPSYPSRMKDGRSITLRGRTLSIRSPKTGQVQTQSINYDGRKLLIYRLGVGPDGQIYGSSALPARLFRWDQVHRRFLDLADLGGGQVYSLIQSNNRLLMAAYGTDAPLYAFDPAKPPLDDPKASNPTRVDYADADRGWRPQALVQGSGGKVYIGAVPGYGKLGGPLCLWDPGTGQVEQHLNLIKDQGITSLCAWTKGRILGGTTISGGLGIAPTQKDAKVFAFDPTTNKVLFELVIPGVAAITNLQLSTNGMLYGIGGNSWFMVDPKTPKLIFLKNLPFPGGTIYGALLPEKDGLIWGIGAHSSAGIFAINPSNQSIQVLARAPKGITASGAFYKGYLYFSCGPDLYRYLLPVKSAKTGGG